MTKADKELIPCIKEWIIEFTSVVQAYLKLGTSRIHFWQSGNLKQACSRLFCNGVRAER